MPITPQQVLPAYLPERAVVGGTNSANSIKSSPESVVQKAVQKGTEMARNGQQDEFQKSPNTKENGRLRCVATGRGGGHGTRNSFQTSNETAISETGGAESGALCQRCKNGLDSKMSNANHDTELITILDAWPTLSPAIQSAITALVRSAGGGDE